MSIDITPNAVSKLRSLLDDQPNAVVKLWVTSGGCNGFRKNLDIGPLPSDYQLFDINGVPLAVDPDSLDILNDSVIDWVTRFAGNHFDIRIASANSSCGCGDSFSL